jgi:DNA-binding transcriptional LysR family regulator
LKTGSGVSEERELTTAGVGLGDLEAFIAVAELGSFSLAAKRLHLSQPAVTARVQKLEASLGTKLLHRTTRTVEVTDVGRRLASHAIEALRNLRVLIGDIARESSTARQRIVLAATPMIAAMLLPKAIRGYVERHPDVQVTVLDLRHSAALDSLERGESDIGVMALDDPQPKFRFLPLTEEELVLVVPPAHPLAAVASVTLQELAPYPVMMLEQYATLQAKVAEAYARQGLRFRPAVKAGNLPTLLGMLDAGNGITLLPRSMAQHNATVPRSVVPILDTDLTRCYGIVIPKAKEMSPALISFCAYLQSELAMGKNGDGGTRPCERKATEGPGDPLDHLDHL